MPEIEGTITIGKYWRSYLSLNLQSFFKNKKVKLYLDEENKLLGLEPSDTGLKPSEYDYRISLGSMRKYLKDRKYPVKWSSTHKMLIIDLKNPIK